MEVDTTRFGVVEVDEDRLITFPAGLLGFTACRRYALLQPDETGAFFWMQSIEDPGLAFVVTDPSLWVPEYRVGVRPEQMRELALPSLDQAQVFVIVNKYDCRLTVNLQGPLVVNVGARRGMQLVLAERKWTTRHEIIQLDRVAEPVPA